MFVTRPGLLNLLDHLTRQPININSHISSANSLPFPPFPHFHSLLKRKKKSSKKRKKSCYCYYSSSYAYFDPNTYKEGSMVKPSETRKLFPYSSYG